MARNEEKHFGRLNRLYLLKENEVREKANPKRPNLNVLYTSEEIQEWLPSIKKDIDFYLKKSQVTCYSDAHIGECHEKVVKLEKEYKAFVRKMKQLATSPIEDIPWNSRPYKRKKPNEDSEESSSTEYKRIATPLLEKESDSIQSKDTFPTFGDVNWKLMDQPLSFSPVSRNTENNVKQKKVDTDRNVLNIKTAENNFKKFGHKLLRNSGAYGASQCCSVETSNVKNGNGCKLKVVDYDASDSDSS